MKIAINIRINNFDFLKELLETKYPTGVYFYQYEFGNIVKTNANNYIEHNNLYISYYKNPKAKDLINVYSNTNSFYGFTRTDTSLIECVEKYKCGKILNIPDGINWEIINLNYNDDSEYVREVGRVWR